MNAADQATAIVCCTLGPLLVTLVIVGVLHRGRAAAPSGGETMSQRTELNKLIEYYGSHRVFLRLARNAGMAGEDLARMERCVAWAMQDIQRELDRMGVPR